MLAAASGNIDAVTRLLDAGAEVNAKEPVRGLTPAMFAAASDRAAVLTLLAKRGADLKATSKVTDLAALSRDPVALREFTQGNPPPPGQPATAGRSGPAPQAAGGRGGRAGQTAGVDRNYQLKRAGRGAGRAHAAPARDSRGARQTRCRRCSMAGADVNQASAGDRTSPLLIATINGHLDLAMLLARQGRGSECGVGEQCHAALRRAERRVGAQGAVIRSRARR